jgi:hypothetical protein
MAQRYQQAQGFLIVQVKHVSMQARIVPTLKQYALSAYSASSTELIIEIGGLNVFEFGEDKPKEECGVFGIYAPEQEVARLTYYGLYALQHRGQESAGIAVSDGHTIDLHKGMGLVSEVFSDCIVENMKGKMAIGLRVQACLRMPSPWWYTTKKE